MTRYIAAALLACAVILSAFAPNALAATSRSPFPQSLQGKPIFVRVHAAWCTECKATQPTIDRIHQKYGNALHYVDFDVTDAKTSAVAAATAKRLHLFDLYDHDKVFPSSVTVINPSTGQFVARFWNNTNEQDYVDAIDKVLRALHAK